MAGGFDHILGSSSSSGDWGGLCFAAILIIGWVIKAISGAVKTAAQQSAQRNLQRVGGPPPMPPMPMVGRPGSALQLGPMSAAQFGKAVNKGAKGKGGRRGQVAIAPPPPPPPPAPMQGLTTQAFPAAQLLGSVQRPASVAGGRPQASRSQIGEAMRRRVIWAEVLGKPIALQDDERSM
jgi:hypothetical protein